MTPADLDAIRRVIAEELDRRLGPGGMVRALSGPLPEKGDDTCSEPRSTDPIESKEDIESWLSQHLAGRWPREQRPMSDLANGTYPARATSVSLPAVPLFDAPEGLHAFLAELKITGYTIKQITDPDDFAQAIEEDGAILATNLRLTDHGTVRWTWIISEPAAGELAEDKGSSPAASPLAGPGLPRVAHV